jgi:hypothetical protein
MVIFLKMSTERENMLKRRERNREEIREQQQQK